jgi:hypothetical protein
VTQGEAFRTKPFFFKKETKTTPSVLRGFTGGDQNDSQRFTGFYGWSRSSTPKINTSHTAKSPCAYGIRRSGNVV